jgi:predicted RNA-binding protein YlxR (DUF448 family)
MSHAVTRPKHIPQRICIVCRSINPKRGLVRLVRTATGGVQIDGTGKQNGRGAYVCQQASCWQTLVERNIVVSALRLSLLTEEDRAALVSFARTIDTSA